MRACGPTGTHGDEVAAQCEAFAAEPVDLVHLRNADVAPTGMCACVRVWVRVCVCACCIAELYLHNALYWPLLKRRVVACAGRLDVDTKPYRRRSHRNHAVRMGRMGR